MARTLHRVSLFATGIASLLATQAPVAAENVETPGWYGYTSELSGEWGSAMAVASDAMTTSAGASATATEAAIAGYHDGIARLSLRPATDPEEHGYSCRFYTEPTNGYYDKRTRYLDAYATASVHCNFTAKEISYTVNFEGYDPADPRGFVHVSSTHRCFNWHTCSNVRAYRRAYTCNGRMRHVAVPFGTYWTPDGKAHRIVGSGMEGPAREGQVVSNYC